MVHIEMKLIDKRKMLHRFVVFSFLITTTLFYYVNGEGCLIEEHPIEPCPDTEYEAYMNCLQQKRVKRSTCNDEPCKECSCSYCESHYCSPKCNDCCNISFDSCNTHYCCYKKCHSQCQSGECRKTCRKSCQDNIEENDTQIHPESVQLPNITTVINLHNQINNTNIVDIPIKINTTNINNITLDKLDLDKFDTVQSDQPMVVDSVIEESTESEPVEVTEVPQGIEENCCMIISPRQCVPQNEFPFMKCFHYRQKACGTICQAPLMHTQTHQVCDENSSGPPECHNQVIYIPQPQPKCTYLDSWPYVSCKIQNMDNTYNVGPYNQIPFGQYQPFTGYNMAPYNMPLGYNMPAYPYFGMENYYSVAKNVEEDVMTNDQPEIHKKLMDFVDGNDISETIPIEHVDFGEMTDPALVKIQVEQQPTLTIQEAKEKD